MCAAAWGHRWTSKLGDSPFQQDGSLTVAGSLWIHQLAGISQRAVLEAIAEFAGNADWPPSLAQIRKCAMGIPTIDKVRLDMTHRNHGFTRLVWSFIDSWAFAHADQHTADSMLRAAYDYATERRLAGDEYPLPPANQLQEYKREHIPTTPEAVANARADIDRIFGINQTGANA